MSHLNLEKTLPCFLKGHWTTSASSPIFFLKKVEIFISLEVYTHVVTACYILHGAATQLQRYKHLVAIL